MGVAIIIAALVGVIVLGQAARAAPADAEAATIAAGIAPPTIPEFQVSISPAIVSSVVETVESAIAVRQAERATFTTLFPLYTAAEQLNWLNEKFDAIHAGFGDHIRTAREVRSIEDGLREKYSGKSPEQMAALVTINRRSVAWQERRPSNEQVTDIRRRKLGIGKDHLPAPIAASPWGWGDPVG
jgi:hypothetical protein